MYSINDILLTKGGVPNIKTSCALSMIERKNNPIHDIGVFKKLSQTLAESKRPFLWSVALCHCTVVSL